jgi:hypothetical protein
MPRIAGLVTVISDVRIIDVNKKQFLVEVRVKDDVSRVWVRKGDNIEIKNELTFS